MENILQALHTGIFLFLLTFRPTQSWTLRRYNLWRYHALPIDNPERMLRRIQWRSAKYSVPFITLVIPGATVCSGCGWVVFQGIPGAGHYYNYCQGNRYEQAKDLILEALALHNGGGIPSADVKRLDQIIEIIEERVPRIVND